MPKIDKHSCSPDSTPNLEMHPRNTQAQGRDADPGEWSSGPEGRTINDSERENYIVIAEENK